MTKIILANGGTIDKYMGDCIMAFWNAPLPCENHAEMAVKSAIEIEEKTNELKEI
jgi:adenylate cyclase